MKSPRKMRHIENDDIICVIKPSGMNTHAADKHLTGCVEYAEFDLQQKLWAVHRLDKETSGVLILSKTKETTQKLFSIFENHEIHKEYLFLTDKKLAPNHLPEGTAYSKELIIFKSFIEKKDNKFVSFLNQKSNSETGFVFIGQSGSHFLWKAIPKTGKPHQIRLHAEQLGIPILGDLEHGGSSFFRLALHSLKIEFKLNDKLFSFKSEIPPMMDFNFEAPKKLTKELQLHFLNFNQCLWEKNQFYTFSTADSFRVIHSEFEVYNFPVRCDQFGEVFWFYWYKDQDPTNEEKMFFEELHLKTQKSVFVRKMNNRGQDPNSTTFWNWGTPQVWSASENDVKYILRHDSGLSPGLFLDQRNNRQWIKSHSKNKKILNLFSYTSGFSVNAALGGASEVTTVDVSKNFIEWSKENFKENHIQIPDQRFSFFVQDVILFLEGTKKRNRKFDIIICDPPSFGRSKDRVFSLEKDFEKLVELCSDCLEPKGIILFSCNFEKWSKNYMEKKFELTFEKLKTKFNKKSPPPQGADFERDFKDPLMKSFIFEKN